MLHIIKINSPHYVDISTWKGIPVSDLTEKQRKDMEKTLSEIKLELELKEDK